MCRLCCCGYDVAMPEKKIFSRYYIVRGNQSLWIGNDLSLPLQEYRAQEREYLQNYVAADAVEMAAPTTIRDLMENEAIAYFIQHFHRPPTMNDLPVIAPGVREYMNEFHSFEVPYGECRLRYIPTSVSAMDAPLDRMRNLCLSGQYPADLYRAYKER